MRKITSHTAAPATKTTQKLSAPPETCSNRQSVRAAPRQLGSSSRARMSFSHFGTPESRGQLAAGEKRENAETGGGRSLLVKLGAERTPDHVGIVGVHQPREAVQEFAGRGERGATVEEGEVLTFLRVQVGEEKIPVGPHRLDQ